MADEKSKTTKLKEKIMMEEPKGIKALTKREIKKADEFCKSKQISIRLGVFLTV